MPDPMKLKKLVDLRRAAGKSQAEAAVYFGLARSARNEIRRWEYGEKIPPPKYRTLFVEYLWDFLDLRQKPEQLENVWAILVEQWGWYPLSEREQQHYLVGWEVSGSEVHDPDGKVSPTNDRPAQGDELQLVSPVYPISGKVLERRGWLRKVLPLLIGLLVLGMLIGISYLSQLHMYDNFNNRAFDGKWDSKFWKLEDRVTLENTIVEQRNGTLSLSRQQSGAGILETKQPLTGEEIRFVEGTVFMDSRTDRSIGSVTIGIAGFVDDEWWWLSCGIQTYSGQNSPQALCSAAGDDSETGDDVEYDTPHTIRIEVDSDSANMTLFVDGTKIDTYTHPNPEAFKKALLRIQLNAYSSYSDLVAGKFDDILIGHK
jgi:hypothetical protein